MSTEENLVRQVEQLEDRIQALEDMFSDRLLSKQQNHAESKRHDAREKLSIGSCYRVFIREVETETAHQSKQGVGQIEGIVTFVEEGKAEFSEGDTVRVKISDVKSSSAEAYAMENLG
jgi:predicted RNA-binding protein with TRAM domain